MIKKNRMNIPMVILFFIFLQNSGFSQTFSELYEEGLKFYEQENYEKAEFYFNQALKYGEKQDRVHFFLGMCSAFQERLDIAENHFLVALTHNSLFEECYIELGGVYFKKKDHRKAEQMIKKAIKINPENRYSHDFLGTLYYINGLTGLALYEWNKINMPILADLSLESNRSERKKLIIQELRFNQGQIIKTSMIAESRKRMRKLGNIANVSFHLVPIKEKQEEFNLLFSFYEEKGFGENLGFSLINLLRDIPQKTLHFDYKNLFDRNINISTVYRFNESRQKFQMQLTFPRLSGLPFYTTLAYAYKNEAWGLQNLTPGQPRWEEWIKTSEFTLRLDYIHNDKISLNHHLRFKIRDVPDNLSFGSREENLFSPEMRRISSFGGEAKFTLIHNFPKNIFSDFSLAYTFLSYKKGNRSRSIKLLLTLENKKVWKRALSDEEQSKFLWRLSSGYSSNEIPIEERFMLGIGPDVQFFLRAHGTTEANKLGNSPIVNRFILSNLEYSHHLFMLFPFKIEGGLFIDCAKIFGKGAVNHENEFIVDFGFFSKIFLFKFPLVFSYGYNIKEKRSAFFLGSHMKF